MLLDAQNLFSDKQNLAQAAGNYLSDKSIDLGPVGTDFHGGAPLNDPGASETGLFAQVVEAFATGDSVRLQLVTADDAALTANLTILQETDAIPTANLVVGYRFRIGKELPAGIKRRYLGMRYVLVAAAPFTAGKITSGLAVDVDTSKLV